MKQLSADASDQMLSGADRLSEEKADAIDALLTKALEDFNHAQPTEQPIDNEDEKDGRVSKGASRLRVRTADSSQQEQVRSVRGEVA